ncbi:MAG: carbohydrate ABC transporter permease [Nitrososphaeria archaeon]
MKKSSPLKKGVFYIIIFIVVFVYLFPFIYVILTSIRPTDEIFSPIFSLFPKKIITTHYVSAITVYPTIKLISNSLLVSLPVVVFSILLALPGGYAFARYQFRLKKLLFLSIIILRFIPLIPILIPLFIFMDSLGLVDTIVGLIIAHTAFKIPFAVWMLKIFINDLPKEIDESAKIDGASMFTILFKIILPLVGPGITAIAIMNFLETWNDFTVALILTHTLDARTLPVGLSQFMAEYQIDWGPLNAASTLALAPLLIFAIFAERYLMKGLTLGAVKG